MASISGVLQDNDGNDLYPYTFDQEVLDANNVPISQRLGSASEASAVAGSSAFAKINTLSSELTSVEAVTPTVNSSIGSLVRNQSYREKIGTQYIYHLDFQIELTTDAATNAYIFEIPNVGTIRNVQLIATVYKLSGGGNYLLVKWSGSTQFLNGDVTIPATYYNIKATFVV